MSKCPDCGMPVTGSACACGWKRGGKDGGHSYRWATKVDGEWIDLQCQFNDHGTRCEHCGTLSPGTNGHGPWYCRNHFGPSGVGAAGDKAPARGWNRVKASIDGMISGREPGEDAA
jgi:hypothetical protein